MFLAKNSADLIAPRGARRTRHLPESHTVDHLASLASSTLAAAALPANPRPALRAAIDAAWRRPEPDCMPPLVEAARFDEATQARIQGLARSLVVGLRAKRSRSSGVDALMKEFSLSSQEGVALMCLAEALLQVPDKATADRLIRDKLSEGDWRSHVGNSPSLFVNAATWGLLITGRLVSTSSEASLSAALTRLVARGGEPLIRKGMDLAMRMLGEQFVTGRDIDEALERGRTHEKQGYRYSFDMLGEAAMTAEDAERYFRDYERAIHAIGKASAGRGVVDGNGISVKLSALHPRYTWSQRERVFAELLPKLRTLCLQAKSYAIGLNIDAEEADRLDISLDLLEALALDDALAGWAGLGFVVQAYQKRAPWVLDFVIDLARRSGQRLMLRLVKGAYWDAEIKRAQIDGLAGYPVYTRKVYTDVAYLACAKKLLAARDAIYPQFATHNAHTLAAIYHHAENTSHGTAWRAGDYEFQCLHGMGEPLYDQIVGHAERHRLVRIYAPVGSHETLLAYLVRRLLENGANTSFVNRIVDENVPVDELIADPVAQAAARSPARRIHASRCRPSCTARSAPIRRASISPASRCGPTSPPPCNAAATRHTMPARSSPASLHRTPAAPARSPTRPTRATSSARSWRPRPTKSRRPSPHRQPSPAAGRTRRRPNAPPASSAPPTCSNSTPTRCWRWPCAKPASRGATRWPNCARRWISAATTRSRRAASTTAAIRRWVRCCASAHGTSRSPSSPASSPPRWPPATRSSPSPPSRRR